MTSASDARQRLLFVGDIILDQPDPDQYFDASRDVLRSGAVVCGHVEVPYTDRGTEQSTDVPAAPSPPEYLAAMRNAGFNVGTMAGNHVFDAGTLGVTDTRAHLEKNGVAPVGAGVDIHEARQPAIVERDGVTTGVLSYNCVGPRESWATSKKAGCAYVNILTHYELDHANPGGTPEIYTFATPESLSQMRDDIQALQERVDVVAVGFHKGVGHKPAAVAMYEPQVSHAAIEAGADIVVGHHAHIMRGIEMYRGRPIFHGLGNFVTVTLALAVEGNDSPERLAWAKRRRELYGFEPDPRMPTYPFHPESRNTIIADCRRNDDGTIEAGFVPCYIEEDGSPVPRAREDGGQEVVDYVLDISHRAGFNLAVEWRDSASVRVA